MTIQDKTWRRGTRTKEMEKLCYQYLCFDLCFEILDSFGSQ
jgi:hypothetical protein